METGRDEGRESERERWAGVGDEELKLSRVWESVEGGVIGDDLSGVDECFGEEGASMAGVLDLGGPPHCDMNDRTRGRGILAACQERQPGPGQARRGGNERRRRVRGEGRREKGEGRREKEKKRRKKKEK